MTTPAAALIVIDAQQEYFAPLGKVVLPDGPAAVRRIADDLGSLDGFLAEIKTVSELKR